MNKDTVFLVAGGDLRQVYTAAHLAKHYNVYAAGFSESVRIPENVKVLRSLSDMPCRADVLILPLPVSQNGVFVSTPLGKDNIPLTALFSVLSDDALIFGGRIDAETEKIFRNNSKEAIDYLEREELSVLNAVPTAEGAVQIAMEEMATTIFGQKVLITGHGRISKVLVKILCGMGADVTVTARKYSDLAWAEIYGCKGVHTSQLTERAGDYSLIFNTVPSVILGEEVLRKVGSDTLIIDLASKPGGVDFEIARTLGLKVVWALSLPGKVAPISAGEIIASTVLNILKERR